MINIEQMREDNVQSHLIFFAEMSSAARLIKIATRLKNPRIFSQFAEAGDSIIPWDYAYAAGLITRAEADLLNKYEKGEIDNNNSENEDEGGDENQDSDNDIVN